MLCRLSCRKGNCCPFCGSTALSVNAGVKDCYAPGEAEETARETLAALLQGTAEGMRSAVTATATGAAVGLYVPGHYTLRLGREKAKLALATSGERVTLTLSMKNPAEAELKLRIPSWTVEPMVQVNDEGGDAPETGKMFTLRRTFRDGDVITLLLPRKARLTEGYHQSLCVMRGDTLLAMPVQGENWRPGAARRAGYGAGDGGCAAGNLPVENPRACACGPAHRSPDRR